MCDGVVGKTPDRASPKLPEKKPSRKRGPTRRSRYKFQKDRNDKRTKTEKDKKTRVVPERETRELRKELAARLLSKVDKYLRGKCPRKYYLSDGRTLDEGKLEVTAAPIIQATLGKSSSPQMVRKCFEMCKSIVKQRRAYVKRKPGTPIKHVVVVEGSDIESSGDGDVGGGADHESSSEQDVEELFEDSEKEDDESQTKEDESQKDKEGDGDSEDGDSEEEENSDDSDYHNRKVEKEAPSRATKMRCQAKDCNKLLPIKECFPKVCNVVKISTCY